MSDIGSIPESFTRSTTGTSGSAVSWLSPSPSTWSVCLFGPRQEQCFDSKKLVFFFFWSNSMNVPVVFSECKFSFHKVLLSITSFRRLLDEFFWGVFSWLNLCLLSFLFFSSQRVSEIFVFFLFFFLKSNWSDWHRLLFFCLSNKEHDRAPSVNISRQVNGLVTQRRMLYKKLIKKWLTAFDHIQQYCLGKRKRCWQLQLQQTKQRAPPPLVGLEIQIYKVSDCSRAVSNTISRQIEYCRLNQSKLRPFLNIHGDVWNIYEGTLDLFRICTQKHTALSSRISPLRLTFHPSGCHLIPSCLLCFVTHFQDIYF